jgi:predicted acylesterase/phospholipase RssA
MSGGSPFSPTLGIAFEGCGCRSAFQAGAIEWLIEQGFRPAAVAGASSGAIVAAALATNRVARLRDGWAEFLGTSICDWTRVLRGRWPLRMTEIVAGAAGRYFGDMLMSDASVPLGIAVTQWRGWYFRRRLITSLDCHRIARVVQASCFIPGPYWKMVPLDRAATFDGAWFARVPVDDVQALGAAKVIACSSDFNGRLLKGVRGTAASEPPRSDFRVLFPVARLALGAFDFDPRRTAAAFQTGRTSAAAFVKTHHRWLSEK